MSIKATIDKIVETSKADINEIVEILSCDNTDYLFKKANEIRKKYCGDEIHLRAIIEFSNYCRCDCLYCGLNRKNSFLSKYRMELDEIVEYAEKAYKNGYKTVVLQSGEDLWYTRDKISYIIRKIKEIGDIAITLSVGERDYEDYKQWRLDGADRFLLKHETADEKLYNYLHPHSSFKNRLKYLKWLKELEYQVGSGFMIDLPGQKLETLAKDILLLKELDVDMAGIGPFVPHPKTELRNSLPGDTNLTLKVLAITRILLKRVHLPTTTSLEVTNIKDRKNAFYTGANVIMRKVQPYKYRKLYEIYPNPNLKDIGIKEERIEIENYIKMLGRKISDTRGDAITKSTSSIC
ncbi:[FeFe] hydrogenase H-cluster radical SAM maturase HydE [Caldisalinibacter kiritimatiensis]|uniref:[FeFe]-hydrogenase maturation protein HydE n=1 Tax=Caldisalinibacter kiritimatiensis TaxID=1304284 RepID=R1CV90_9FIRM|nr:[FeFe] hydrogenase H-cluster radical SAM maturase HydE [Caldisalinibacter kiritimatiensis]EOD00549.1 [FeFe]-hydrogenase maturation protein HydE [Caldisalinibacter kiritimatiensis]